MDPRIIQFKDAPSYLPNMFIPIEPKNMIYAAGDGYGGFMKNGADMEKTNIECFSKLGYNIFCCSETDIPDSLRDNINYLQEHPELNVILCILTGDNSVDYPILQRLFDNSLSLISTDDKRVYPSATLAFSMLKLGGICEHVHISHIYNNHQWSEPNFKLLDVNNYFLRFKKISLELNNVGSLNTFENHYVSAMINNTQPNINKRKQILKQFLNKINTNRSQSWKRWHTKRGGKINTRKRIAKKYKTRKI
jgi:hypothetical protein